MNPFTNNLHNEIMSEKVSALCRISDNLSLCLKELEHMESQVNNAIDEGLSCRNINKLIEDFNRKREDAEEWRYYLIVTREASGLFQSGLSASVYRIPPRKDPLEYDGKVLASNADLHSGLHR